MLWNEDTTKVLETQTGTRRKKPAFVTLGLAATPRQRTAVAFLIPALICR